MDDRTKELIALGASVSGHCQPCLDYHLGRARELSASEEEIRTALEIGYMVEKGAMVAMRNYAKSIFDPTQSQSSDCCADSNTKCCG
ncbi:MAG: carboxymuconolactone decarboxylase family protein [bacterium]|nr:carboxymuconolactone decarboxylase family protein [bacterium]MCX6834566.1 carboxymuconolactone decarboxylase family protein [candidate division Zixibacteria bacterium]